MRETKTQVCQLSGSVGKQHTYLSRSVFVALIKNLLVGISGTSSGLTVEKVSGSFFSSVLSASLIKYKIKYLSEKNYLTLKLQIWRQMNSLYKGVIKS